MRRLRLPHSPEFDAVEAAVNTLTLVSTLLFAMANAMLTVIDSDGLARGDQVEAETDIAFGDAPGHFEFFDIPRDRGVVVK